MAITTVPAFWYPTFIDPQPAGSIGSLSSILMNAVNDKVAFIVTVPKPGTLDKAEFYMAAVGNNPDNGIRISFQGVDATTGFPDGVQDQYRDITGTVSVGWQTPGLMTSDGTDGGSKRSVTQGEKVAVVIEFVSFVASDSVSPGIITSASSFTGGQSLMYTADASTGTYVKTTTSQPIVVLKYDDSTYALPTAGVGYGPVTTFTNTSYASNSTPDEYASTLQFPFGVRVIGAWARMDLNDDCDLVLYSGTSALATTSIDKDITASNVAGLFAGYFASSQTLSANTTYRIAVKPTTTTTSQIYRFTFPSTAIMNAQAPGSNWYESTRTDAGSWSDTTTNRPVVGLILDGIDASGGASSGGSFTFVG